MECAADERKRENLNFESKSRRPRLLWMAQGAGTPSQDQPRLND